MKKILLVDDDEIVLEYHLNALKDHFQLETALNGKMALDIMDSVNPDIILMDIRMPEISGYETCEILRKAGNKTPILFLSGLSSLEERMKAYDVGGNDFITKPAEPQELIKKIEILLEYSQKADSGSQDTEGIAQQAFSELSYLGLVLGFFRGSNNIQRYDQLAEALFKITKAFGLKCTLIFRPQMTGEYCFFDDSLHKNIEVALLESLSEDSRILEFGNHRAAFNWSSASLLVKNMPKDDIKCGAMRDYIAYLMDGVEQCAIKISIESRLRSAVRNFKNQNEENTLEIVKLIDDLEDRFDRVFSEAGFDDDVSLRTEEKLIRLIKSARNSADATLRSGYSTDRELDAVIKLFEPKEVQKFSQEIELF